MNKEELTGYCESELARLDSFADGIKAIATEGKTDFSEMEMAAISAFFHYLYTSVENVIREILRFDGINEFGEDRLNQKLLKTAGELGIVPPDLFKPFRAFMHSEPRSYWARRIMHHGRKWNRLFRISGVSEHISGRKLRNTL